MAQLAASGVRALLVTNPEKVQLIQPPMRIMGSTLVTFPFIMSVSMLGSVNRERNKMQIRTNAHSNRTCSYFVARAAFSLVLVLVLEFILKMYM